MSVKKYSLKKQGNIYCSKHTQVKEMASVGQGKTYSDTVLVDEKLMEMVEKLFSKLNCKYYLISSGYRTSAHDKAVGGDGKGQHTKGKAVDACFYGKDGKAIPAQIVCCVAQDLGFRGIANISNNYRYVHLDVRSSGKYMGNEAVSAYTVTKDFYKYFSVSKDEVAKYTGEKVKETEYYKRYSGQSVKLDTVLKEIGVEAEYIGSWKKRKPLASVNGITNYIGISSQNLKLINLAKQGKLKKV